MKAKNMHRVYITLMKKAEIALKKMIVLFVYRPYTHYTYYKKINISKFKINIFE
jgi:hypothetical protein